MFWVVVALFYFVLAAVAPRILGLFVNRARPDFRSLSLSLGVVFVAIALICLAATSYVHIDSDEIAVLNKIYGITSLQGQHIIATDGEKADSNDRRKHDLCWPIGRTPETDPALPHCDTRRVHFDRRVSPEARDLASLFSTLLVAQPDKHGAVLGLVQDEPALRAGAASGILDKTCARRSARGRSAPRNGPLSLTKECNLDLESGEATSEPW